MRCAAHAHEITPRRAVTRHLRLRSLHTAPCTSQPRRADSLRLLYSLLAGPDSLVLLGSEVTLNSTCTPLALILNQTVGILGGQSTKSRYETEHQTTGGLTGQGAAETRTTGVDIRSQSPYALRGLATWGRRQREGGGGQGLIRPVFALCFINPPPLFPLHSSAVFVSRLVCLLLPPLVYRSR